VYITLDSMYMTMSVPTGLYPKLDLWNANKLHYITLHPHDFQKSVGAAPCEQQQYY